jgi:hypothetical protein
MKTLRHEKAIALARRLYRRYHRNRDLYETRDITEARQRWLDQFGEF